MNEESTKKFDEIKSLIKQLNPIDWPGEAALAEQIYKKLQEHTPGITITKGAFIMGRSKAWLSVSLTLARGLRTHPDLHKLVNRRLAYTYVLNKRAHEEQYLHNK